MIAFAAVVLLDPVCFVLCRVGILSLSYLTKEYIHIFFNIFSVLFCFTVASVYFGREPKEAIKLIDLASFEIYLWHLLLMHAVDFLMPGVFGISARYILRAVCVMIGAPVICSLLVIIKGRLFKRKNT